MERNIQLINEADLRKHIISISNLDPVITREDAFILGMIM